MYADRMSAWDGRGYKASLGQTTYRLQHDLRIFRGVQPNVAIEPGPNGTQTVRTVPAVLQLRPLEWAPCANGEMDSEPALSSSAMIGSGGDVMQFIQAVVDLGAELGMNPSVRHDRSAEVERMRYHLEDMRKLAGLRDANQPPR
jgi:hypothetical protein